MDNYQKMNFKEKVSKALEAKANPKSHDSLVKWLISSFTEEFFAHYFPEVKIGKYTFIDKEFISKYEALKDSLEGDLFLIMEMEIDNEPECIVIQMEHQRKRENMDKRSFQYMCYSWLLKEKPVWSIVIYTDDAVWIKEVPNKYWYAYNNSNKKQYYHFDVIKIKKELSIKLIESESMLCKLF